MTGKARVAARAARARGKQVVRASLLAASVVLSAGIAGPAAVPAHAADAPSPVHAAEHATPEQVVAAFHAALLRAMRDGTYQSRYDGLTSAMNRAFDFAAMTQIAIGPRWYNLQPEQQEALVDAFRRFSIATYASQFDTYSGERFEAAGPSETAPQGVVVETVMQPSEGKAIRFNYLLHRTAAGWRIVDIYLDGTISQLAVRRSEFTSVLAQEGPDGLAHLLDQKAKRLAMM